METGLKHDKIKFHEFFCVCNFFLSPPLSFSPHSLSLSPVSPSLSPLYLSLSHPVSLPISLSFSPVSSSLSPCISLSLYLPCISFSHPRLSTYFSLSLSLLSLFLSVSPIPISLSFFFPSLLLSLPSLVVYIPPNSLKMKIKKHKFGSFSGRSL